MVLTLAVIYAKATTTDEIIIAESACEPKQGKPGKELGVSGLNSTFQACEDTKSKTQITVQ